VIDGQRLETIRVLTPGIRSKCPGTDVASFPRLALLVVVALAESQRGPGLTGTFWMSGTREQVVPSRVRERLAMEVRVVLRPPAGFSERSTDVDRTRPSEDFRGCSSRRRSGRPRLCDAALIRGVTRRGSNRRRRRMIQRGDLKLQNVILGGSHTADRNVFGMYRARAHPEVL
jgi:hypothetical protein